MSKYSIILLLALVSLFLGNVYYCMRRTIDLKTMRYEADAKGPCINEIVASNYKEQIYSSVRRVIREELGDILDQVGLIKSKIFSSPLAIAGKTDELLVGQEISTEEIQMTNNRMNYADENLGAYIEHVEGELAENGNFLSWIGIASNSNQAEQILRSNMKLGSCFAFKHKKAAVVIALPERIYIDAIKLQHIPKYRTPMQSTSSAPLYISVYAITAINSEQFLGDFEYKNHTPSQVFSVAAKVACHRIRLVFSGNHGNPEYTCIYRVAVYGRPAV